MLQELEQGEEGLQAALAAANSKLRARALEDEQHRELCAQVLSLLALPVQKVLPSLLTCFSGTRGADVQLCAQQGGQLAAVARVLQTSAQLTHAARARTRNATATAGVGITIQCHPRTGACTVKSVQPRIGESAGGICVGDTLESVDGVSVQGMQVSRTCIR